MTIPGRGDLSPRRKHRDWRRRLAGLFAVLVVGAAGYGGYRLVSGGSPKVPVALVPCPTTSTRAPVAAQGAQLTVRNATLKTGLAKEVARAMRQRHFLVGKPGNTLFRGKGVATVQYSADRLQAARLVAAQFAGATLVQVGGAHVLEVDIGPKFRALVPLPQARAAEHAINAGTSSPSPSSTPTPTCLTKSPTTKVTQ